MSSVYTNVLVEEELYYLNNHPEVIAAKSSLETKSSGIIYFSIPITESIRNTLQSRLGLQLPVDSRIPMRWIKGDTAPHVDTGSSEFKNTYLLYLNDSPGELIIDSQSYPIKTNTGFVFNEGLSHETMYTENVPRLLLGPMNEHAQPVGGPVTFYYPTQNDALTNQNLIISFGSYHIQTVIVNGISISSWNIAYSTGPPPVSPQNVVYNVGDVLIGDGGQNFYYLYPAVPCFLEGSKILCQVDGIETYIPVEQLKQGTLVKTCLNGYKPVVLTGKGTIENPGDNERSENRLYKCCTSKYPQLNNDLYITGCHSILEFPITDKQKEDTIKRLGRLFVTDKKYRLMACVDERAEPWNSKGTYTIWHFALENENERMNYGVYANGGLLVETCSIYFLKRKSNMMLT
jgi:hypothetical protein